jgi:hypothetical protein
MKETGSINGTPLSEQLLEWIRLRAYELYQLRGEAHGHDTEDWVEAERQIGMEMMVRSHGQD